MLDRAIKYNIWRVECRIKQSHDVIPEGEWWQYFCMLIKAEVGVRGWLWSIDLIVGC